MFKSSRRRGIGLLVGLCFLLTLTATVLPTPVARAARLTPSLTVRAGFDGYYKQDSWLPLQVNLKLPEGNPDFDGWLEASWTNFAPDSARYRRRVQLTPPANRNLWLYLPSDARSLAQVQVRLTDTNEAVVESREITVQALSPTEMLIGVVSDDSNALNNLNGERLTQPFNRNSVLFSDYASPGNQRPAPGPQARPVTRLAHLSATDLPTEMAGWDGLDGLVLSDLTTVQLGDQTLNQDSLGKAAAGWLAQGRFLVAAGDSTLRRGGFLLDLLPVKVAGLPKTKSFPTSLNQFVRNDQPPTQVLVAQIAPLIGAKQLITQDGQPLVVSRPFGLGTSWFVATDLKALDGTSGLQFWRYLLSSYEPHIGYVESHRQADNSSYQSWANLVNPNNRPPTRPDAGLLALVLVVYSLAVGPGTFLLVRRLKRPGLSWLIVPGLAIGLSLLFWLVGLLAGGESLVVSRLSVITLGETAGGQLSGGTIGLTTLYASSQSRFDLTATEQSVTLPLDPNRSGASNAFFSTSQSDQDTRFLTVQQGARGGYGSNGLGLNEQRSFALEQNGLAGLSGGIVARLTTRGDELEGTLENQTGTDWADLSVWKPGGQIYNLPILKAGETITLGRQNVAHKYNALVYSLIGLDRATLAGSIRNSTPNRQESYAGRKAAVLSSLLGRDGEVLARTGDRLYMVAWKQSVTNFGLGVENHGVKTSDLTLLFEPLALR